MSWHGSVLACLCECGDSQRHSHSMKNEPMHVCELLQMMLLVQASVSYIGIPRFGMTHAYMSQLCS